MRKFFVALLVALVIAAVGWYIASPYVAFYHLQRAAKAGDRATLEDEVDFPAVREDFKAQLNAALMAKLGGDPGLKDNPLAAIGLLLGPPVIDRAVDLYVTPDGIAQMVAKARTPKQGARPENTQQVVTHTAYVSLNRFQATVTGSDDSDKPLVFVLERRGLFDWKLVRIELPLDAIKP